MTVSYVVDTDWVIHYLNGRSEVVTRLAALKEEGLGLAVVSLAELYEGVFYSRDPEKQERSLGDFRKGVELLPIDDEICRIFGKERGRLRKAGTSIADIDLLIASTALHHKATLLTNNRRHFDRVKNLKIESAR